MSATMLVMTDNEADNPYKTLGWHLKFAREQQKKSLAEVSGAVEIDVDALKGYEQGDHCPSEDILLLLINYLGLEDAEASSLWQLAGYNDDNDEGPAVQPPLTIAMPYDLRIVYTDMLHVVVNDYGVVMNFMQGGGKGHQPLGVARVGMSKKQARRVINILQKSLDTKAPTRAKRYLPNSKNSKDSSK